MRMIASSFHLGAPAMEGYDATQCAVDRSHNKPTPIIRKVILVATAAFFLALPMLAYGPLRHGYDTREHLSYSRNFTEQFWAGEWYPRWLIGIHHGLGSPSLFVYPPLPTYVQALLEPLARLLHFYSFRMAEYLALFVSGACAWLWLTTFASTRWALIGSILYMSMPYHLALDYYRKTALAECWALAWFPLVLYFTAQIINKRKPSDVVGLAVAYALLILSHLVSVLIFSWIPLMAAVWFSGRCNKLRSVCYVLAGMLLGTGLSSFYFLSALANAKYFPVYRLPLWHLWQRYQLSMTVLSDSSYDSFTRATYFSVLDMLFLMLVCGLVLLLGHESESRERTFFWLVVSIVPTLLMLRLSSPIWAGVPLLLTTVQFPFRFSIVLCIAATAVVTLCLERLSELRSGYKALLLVLVFVGLAPFALSYVGVWRSYLRETEPPKRIVNEGDGWFYSWTPIGMEESKALEASAGPAVRFAIATGSATAVLWKPRHIEFDTDSPVGGWVIVKQFYYPGWQATLPDSNIQIPVKAALPEGLLEALVPSGQRRIRLEIPTSRAERYGDLISIFCALLCPPIVWRSFHRGDEARNNLFTHRSQELV